MPNTKSAKKRLVQNEKTRLRNRSARSFVRNRIKKLIATLKTGDFAAAEEQVKSVCSSLDRAAANKIWHRNNVSRKKSRLSALIRKTKLAAGEKK